MTVNPIILQIIYYGAVMLITVFLIGLMLKGFFFKFLRVKLSFGKLILVKLKTLINYKYSVGKIEEGFLVFNTALGTKRISVKDDSVFYRSIGIAWVNIDDEKNTIIKPSGEHISGHDPIKWNNLYVRCLSLPKSGDPKTKIIIGCLFLIVILILGVCFMIYKQNYTIQALVGQINSLKGSIATAIKPASNVIA